MINQENNLLATKEINKLFIKLTAASHNTPLTELIYPNNYCLLIAVVLSAQATDVAVNKATASLFKIADNPQKMLSLGREALISYIRTIGLFNGKATNIIKLSQILVDKYHSEVPSTLEELQALPGVGRKTANVILNIAFNQLTIAVDTHVFRVSRRLGLSYGNSPLAVEKDLVNTIPKEHLKLAHSLLILHGRYVCKAKKPLCQTCIIREICKNPLY